MKYRENSSTRELHQLLRELAIIDSAYRRMEMDQRLETLEAVDEVDDLRRAALNHRGQP